MNQRDNLCLSFPVFGECTKRKYEGLWFKILGKDWTKLANMLMKNERKITNCLSKIEASLTADDILSFKFFWTILISLYFSVLWVGNGNCSSCQTKYATRVSESFDSSCLWVSNYSECMKLPKNSNCEKIRIQEKTIRSLDSYEGSNKRQF